MENYMDHLKKTSLTKIPVSCYIYFIDIAKKIGKCPLIKGLGHFFTARRMYEHKKPHRD